MQRVHARVILPVITALIAVLWMYVGLVHHGWWQEGRPQSGFFPTIVGAILLFVSVLAIIGEAKEEPPAFIRSHVVPVLAAVGMVVLALLVGFFPALVVYVFGWLKWYEKYSLLKSALTTGITTALMYGIFAAWLRVPFPGGMLVELVL